MSKPFKANMLNGIAAIHHVDGGNAEALSGLIDTWGIQGAVELLGDVIANKGRNALNDAIDDGDREMGEDDAKYTAHEAALLYEVAKRISGTPRDEARTEARELAEKFVGVEPVRSDER